MAEMAQDVGRRIGSDHSHWAPRESLPSLRRDVDDRLPGQPPSRPMRALATGLGWFSIGLGLAEMLAPRDVAKTSGMASRRARLLPLMGAREFAAGVGILASEDPTGWLWARVAGDAIDLAMLGSEFSSDDSDAERVTAATAAVVGVTILDVIAALRCHAR